MKYKTCVSIGEKNPKKLKNVLKKALLKSDFAEIRFDYLKKADIPIVLEDIKKSLSRCVCTLRPRSEGGVFIGKEDERRLILRLIAEYNPFLLDVEFNAIQKDKKLASYLRKTKCKLLISWHDFKKTPNESQLRSKFNKMAKFSDIVKIVTVANSVSDASRLLSLYSIKSENETIAFCMGEQGKFSRILCLHLGSPFTYVSLGKAIAPGQFSLREIKSLEC
ncbi:MAG: type I 3-dehydroquinate dehydratase [Candidatus Nitrosopelagicus sp.]|jgi:3-dehydroquinate dehydratase-1|nr:type I 3-dehydroquinate dehydratase [Candidatus Nitrosopelagicus sp.]MBT6647411.1 type I 3-dehydroquinate dehydratase [Nitrososphaerota archaeon]MBT3761716.1 type I 3-dehydroquinate dehydratase [Candidatus Nitrosopelagicus sp.]MBT4325697.1 type I 3-dehydroquinate dehydratase [Candidatus Nitrosopelagicus sp.]MBT4455452.1 type I 3-dehydroquinate dehydratase [Candidatus Nitrosopelagicus sp.]